MPGITFEHSTFALLCRSQSHKHDFMARLSIDTTAVGCRSQHVNVDAMSSLYARGTAAHALALLAEVLRVESFGAHVSRPKIVECGTFDRLLVLLIVGRACSRFRSRTDHRSPLM